MLDAEKETRKGSPWAGIRMHYTPEHCLVNGGVQLYFGGKSHVSNGQSVSFKEPCWVAVVSWRGGERREGRGGEGRGGEGRGGEGRGGKGRGREGGREGGRGGGLVCSPLCVCVFFLFGGGGGDACGGKRLFACWFFFGLVMTGLSYSLQEGIFCAGIVWWLTRSS